MDRCQYLIVGVVPAGGGLGLGRQEVGYRLECRGPEQSMFVRRVGGCAMTSAVPGLTRGL